jgi:competence protein ComEC
MRHVVIALILAFWPAWLSAQTLRIYHIDVEQADSALIVMPNGKTLLIDSGKNGHGNRIKAVMDQAGVTRIDAFVNSHYHEDHFGGIDDLVEMGVEVLEAYDRGDKSFLAASKKSQGTYKDYMEWVGEDAQRLRPGDTIDLDPLVTVACIAASGSAVGNTTSVDLSEDHENDFSVSLLLSFAGFKGFFGGDTEQTTEAIIATGDLVRDVDLYKSSHHGSHTSSSLPFMSDLSPSLVVISNGNDSNYKHPRQVTLQTYAQLPTPPTVLQTNKCKRGLPCANVPDAFIGDPETGDKDGTIQITVDATSGIYTARYSANTVRTFQIKNPTQPSAPSTPSSVVIASLLPNPVGDDEQLEEVTVRNRGTATVSLEGWTLRDRSGLTWRLVGSVAAGQAHNFRRGGQPMTLNNAGDEITLVDSNGNERDRFSYPDSEEDERIVTNH